MSYETLAVDLTDGVLAITLNRPEALNAWNGVMRAEMKHCIAELRDKTEARAILLTGTGRAFSAGGDVKEMQPNRTPAAIRNRLHGFLADVLRPLLELEKPIVTAVNGPAIGAGMALALTGDMILAADTAYFSAPFVSLGLVPDAAAAFLLTRALGSRKAKQICLSAKRIAAQEALEIGLVDEVTSPDDLLARARTVAASLSQLPPMAARLTKMMFDKASSATLTDMIELEALSMAIAASDPDHAEALAAFREKRPPQFHKA